MDTAHTNTSPSPDVLAHNTRCINRRIELGLNALGQHFSVTEHAVDPALANPVIGGRPHHARRFDIAGVGNLLAMTVTETDNAQLSSFVITPYAKNLPLFSTDFVYLGESRFFLIEIYDLGIAHDEAYQQGIQNLKKVGLGWTDMADFPLQPCWYDDIRPVCHAKAYSPDQDELAIRRFLEALQTFIDFAQTMPALTGDDLQKKWQLNRDYADRLINEGGVSTDLFTQAIGAENTRRFFHEVFFGPSWYRAE